MDLLREELGIQAKVVKGSGGIFTVAVNGKVVARKTAAGFPTDAAILDAVRAEMAHVR